MSTKCTLLFGEDFHIYYDYAEFNKPLIMEIRGERVDVPDEMARVLRGLIDLHAASKRVLELTTRLDENDAGLFAFDLNTGEKKEW